MIRRLLFLGAALTPALFACDGGDGTTPSAPAPAPAPTPAATATPAPAPAAFTVSFVDRELELREGETRAVKVRYEVRELAAAAEVRLAASNPGASEGDYQLSAMVFEIPAGTGVSGEASVELTATTDLLFTEGAETLPLTLNPGDSGKLGSENPLNVKILDAPAAVCPGMSVGGAPWTEHDTPEAEDPRKMYATKLRLEVAADATGTRLELLGPYVDLPGPEKLKESDPIWGISRWGFRSEDGMFVHDLDVSWSGEAWFKEPDQASLQFAVHGEGCSGTPTLSCTSGGCQVMQ